MRDLIRRVLRRPTRKPSGDAPPSDLVDMARRGLEVGGQCPGCGRLVTVDPDGWWRRHKKHGPLFAGDGSWCPVGDAGYGKVEN